MNTFEHLKHIYSLMVNPNQESLKLSMRDTHHEDIFSLVISGTEFGNLTRVFISDVKLKPYEVQLHTHRYPVEITPIKGIIKHFIAFRSEVSDAHTVSLSEYEYKSPLNGGTGLKYLKDTNVIIKDYTVPIGSRISLSNEDFHTMACSKGSMWIVEEKGFKSDSSRVLGVPFVTSGLYNPPASFQINDKFQIVLKEIKSLLLHYETIV